ncbi:Eukaryotic translation initiation factor 5A-2 [Hordeum vulgare]|nr:Eukaryotic translation initiation factor 5A-2 [Hordeum vulgare]
MSAATQTPRKFALEMDRAGHKTDKMGSCHLALGRQVVDVSTSGSGGYASCHFVAIDIFTGEKFEYSVSSSRNCDVPYVIITEYQLLDIPDDGGFVTLLTDTGSTKDDIKLPTDDSLRDQLKDDFNEGKDLMVSVMSAMGEEQICGFKDIAPRFLSVMENF